MVFRCLRRVREPAISRRVAEIFERIGTSAETWHARLVTPSEGRLLGRFLAASRQRLREVGQRLGLRGTGHRKCGRTRFCDRSQLSERGSRLSSSGSPAGSS